MSFVHPNMSGWRDALISVSDLKQSVSHYQKLMCWKPIGPSHDVDKALLEAWGLPNAASAREQVLVHETDRDCRFRLIEFSGVKKRQIRPGGRFWDPGGISNLSCRVESMAETYGAMKAAGWVGHHEPVAYKFGPFTVEEVAATGPDGVNFSLVERIDPPLKEDEKFGTVGPIFNSPQIFEDIEQAFGFYRDGLGFKKALDTQIVWQPPGSNVFGLPYKIAMNTPVRVGIVHPQGTMNGCIELIESGEWSSNDFSRQATPPNLGIMSLRFVVPDYEAYMSRIKSSDHIQLNYEDVRFHSGPDGDQIISGLYSPNGSLLEFVAPSSSLKP